MGYEGQARSEAMKLAHDAHFTKVMANRRAVPAENIWERMQERRAKKRAARIADDTDHYIHGVV